MRRLADELGEPVEVMMRVLSLLQLKQQKQLQDVFQSLEQVVDYQSHVPLVRWVVDVGVVAAAGDQQ